MLDRTLENHRLLKDCIEALGVNILSYEDGLKISALFEKICPLRGWDSFNKDKFDKKPDAFKSKYQPLRWGKVDWERFDQKIEVGYDPEKIIPTLETLLGKNFDREVYIEWDTCILVIKTHLDDIIKNFDIVVRVSSYQFIFNPIANYIVEISPGYPITVGILPTSDKFFQKTTYVDPDILQHDVVFKECIEALNIDLLPSEEEKSMDAWFKKMCPMTKWGRVDWEKFDNKTKIGNDYKNIKRVLGKFLQAKGPFDTTVYIEWGEAGIPVIKTNIGDVIGNFTDVECVAFEKFLFNPSLGYVIEILNGRQMTVGIVPNFVKQDAMP